MKKIEKLNKILYVLIFTILSMFVFVININSQNMSFYQDRGALYQFVMELWLSIKSFDIIYITLGIFIYYTYYHIYFDGTPMTKKTFINAYFAIVLTFVVLTGKAYRIDNTLSLIFSSKAQIFKCAILSLGYYYIFYALIKKISSIKIDKTKLKIKKKNKNLEKVEKFIEKYHILIGVLVILLGWLPYIILYYPGASTGDTFDSLCQYFHQSESWSIKTVNLIDEGMYINKHHPVFFTVILGTVFKIGKQLGSFTIGALIYTILQIILLEICYGFMLHYMKKVKAPLWLRIISTLFISLTPTIAAHAITAVKDTPSAIFTMIYTIFLIQIVRNYDSIFKKKFRLLTLMIVMLLVILLRNNGIITILLSFPLLILVYKEHYKKILMILIVIIGIFGIYDKILLSSFNITNGSIKEVLTIPFMQVGRVVRFNHEKLPKEDKEIVNKVLDWDAMISFYDPYLADSIKDTYKKDATNQDLKEFFSLWLKYLKKYPKEYIESFITSTYGYFFPEVGEEYAVLAVDSRVGPTTYFDIKPVEKFSEYREISVYINKILATIPFFNLFNHVAFYDWFLIFSCVYIIRKKKAKYLIPMLPLLSVLLVCLASPINGSFRYILPIVMSAPMILTLDYLVTIEEEN